MLERFFVKPQTVDGIMGWWLGSQIDQYVAAVCERVYAVRSIYRRVPILTKLAAFTAARNVDQIEQPEALIEPFIDDWLSLIAPIDPLMRVDAIATSSGALCGISSARSSRSRITPAVEQLGRSLSLPRCRDSLITFTKSGACARPPSITTGTICAVSSDISGMLDAR
ncbi:hypothetical protein [Mesorhizobium sp. LNJC391B00]|uniref:hypothetical protein n=1 Tax=Mesorhizobium sp. LNJC391B00 TaxID=1287273 RepID=UPI001FD89AAD|nr:hypothetical protein [Mesorhizobium sp. LNJC391B00]